MKKNRQILQLQKEIIEAIKSGESLEQLAEMVDKNQTPDFYGEEFRRAYSEGIEAGSAYGYEQPLDFLEAAKVAVSELVSVGVHLFPPTVESFECVEEVTEEAVFEVIENPELLQLSFPFYRVPAAPATTEEAFGLLDHDKMKLLVGSWNYELPEHIQVIEAKEEPGEDLILTPLGEMTFQQWDTFLGLCSEEERKQFEAPEN